MLSATSNKNIGTISIQKYDESQGPIKSRILKNANYITKGSTSTSSESTTNILNIEAFENDIKEISKHATKKIEDLNRDIKEKIDDLGRVISICKKIQSFELMIEIIDNYFTNETVEPGTVEAFFHGCRVASNFPGNNSCSATCAGNVPPPYQTPGWENCNDNVFLMSDGKLDIRSNIKSSSHAIVHVIDGDYKYFTRENIELFKDLGITHVSVNVLSEGNYVERGVKIPIEKLNIIKEENNFYINKRNMEIESSDSDLSESISGSEIEYSVSLSDKQNKKYKKSTTTSYDKSKSNTSSSGSWASRSGSDDCDNGSYGYIGVIIFIVVIIIFIIGAACYYSYQGGEIVSETTCKTSVTHVEDESMISLGEMSGGPGWISSL